MRVTRVRIIAWALGLLAVIVVIGFGRGSLRLCRVTPEALPPLGAAETSHPRLFQAADTMERLPSGEQPVVRSAALLPVDAEDAPITLRDLAPAVAQRGTPANTHAVNVIREPESSVARAQEEQRVAAKYALEVERNGDAPQGSQPLSSVPVELMLASPEREVSKIEPRVAQEVTVAPAEPEAGPAPPLPVLSSHDPAMRPVNEMAGKHVYRGFSLGERNATYAARTEFIQALRTIAQAVDAQAGLAPKSNQSCSLALVRGLQALSEADDFAPIGSRLDGDLDLTAIIAAHRTAACKQHPPASQLAALQAYFDYAGQQLTRAGAGSPVASQALAGLGKSYTSMKDSSANRLAGAKAMVFHQAALGADPRNHLAANELGVLLAKYGQYQQAKQAFTQSLRTHADAATWQNLAAIHAKLGEQQLATLASQERELLTQGALPNSYSAVDGSATVQWVEPKAFAGPPEDANIAQAPIAAPPAATPNVNKSKTPQNVANKSDPWGWLPWR